MSETETVYRTTTARTGKMMAIMLGICIVGGAIFFGMWDYWISQPPPVATTHHHLSNPLGVGGGGDLLARRPFCSLLDVPGIGS